MPDPLAQTLVEHALKETVETYYRYSHAYVTLHFSFAGYGLTV